MTRHSSKTESLLDELLKGSDFPQHIFGEYGLLKALTKRLVERELQVELTNHLGHAPVATVYASCYAQWTRPGSNSFQVFT
jgi:hypothetical protein